MTDDVRRQKPARTANPGYRPRTGSKTRLSVLSPAAPPETPPPSRPKRMAKKEPQTGPLPVPISTIDWLLSREAPAARYVALRDLLARSPKEIELRKAKQSLLRDPFIRDTIPHLRRSLSPTAAAADLERRYDGGYWQALFLVEVGCDLTDKEIRYAGDVLFSRFERLFVEIERDESTELPQPIFSIVCYTLAAMGHANDARLHSAAAQVARKRITSAADTADLAGLVKDLRFLATVPEAKRTPLMTRAVDFVVERALALVGKGPAGGFGVPTGAGTDRLELLDTLVSLRVPMREELPPLLSAVAARADHRARWTLEKGLPERSPVRLERDGELSRWVTVRALRVLQNYVGLSIVEKR